jgi:hypothetical protein
LKLPRPDAMIVEFIAVASVIVATLIMAAVSLFQ